MKITSAIAFEISNALAVAKEKISNEIESVCKWHAEVTNAHSEYFEYLKASAETHRKNTEKEASIYSTTMTYDGKGITYSVYPSPTDGFDISISISHNFLSTFGYGTVDIRSSKIQNVEEICFSIETELKNPTPVSLENIFENFKKLKNIFVLLKDFQYYSACLADKIDVAAKCFSESQKESLDAIFKLFNDEENKD